ncbi:hypothetical protein K504DRAFT_504517 [Pleomassaria siparia CBS 279.74]|uniref:BTB domain-containing protein n=1 Tax=Pleomassaria siparia CBS 279.74 TaxID=1314801 RepID=A0A6G1K3A2_9PLEO|nr:hypothetical protein K504DRAFT_504517 [Pleomassaria siparia CBS 279.74]
MTENKKALVAQSFITNFLNSPDIVVRVGEGDDFQDFFIHKDPIIPSSSLFAKALSGTW